MGNESYLEDGRVPVYLKALASALYVPVFVLSLLGNTLVIFVAISRRRSVRVNQTYQSQMSARMSNFFIVNLAVADMAFSLLCIPSTYVAAYLVQYWPLNAISCVLINFAQTAVVTSTVYILVLITLDKYLTLMHPFGLRLSVSINKILVALIWALSALSSLPILLFTKLYKLEGLSGPQCIEQWPESIEHFSQLYNIFLLVLQYFLPLVFLSYCYIRIGLKLHRRRAPGEFIMNRDEMISKSKRKLIKMCSAMVFTFLLFWTPMHFLNLYRFYDASIVLEKHFGLVFLFCHFLAVSRTWINPLIYARTNTAYKRGLIRALRCQSIDEPNLTFSEIESTNSLRRSSRVPCTISVSSRKQSSVKSRFDFAHINSSLNRNGSPPHFV
nr:G protein-coupled receptor [Proales similis]